jgi:DnaK suppressor protein
MAIRNAEKTEYEQIQRRLEQEQKLVARRLEAIRSDIMTGSESSRGSFAEVEDQAAESSSLQNLLAQEERLVDELSDLDAALKRIQSGTYGLCEKCGCKIGLNRLQVMPSARLCIEDARRLGSARSCRVPVMAIVEED